LQRGGAFALWRETAGTPAQGESAATPAIVVKCGKERRSPNDYAATLLREPRSFVLDFLVRPITLERGST